MSTESTTYCDNCHRVVAWNDNDHDGKTCPNCGKVFKARRKGLCLGQGGVPDTITKDRVPGTYFRPPPEPEPWLVEALAENARANERRARSTNIIFALVYLLFFLFVIGWMGGYWL